MWSKDHYGNERLKEEGLTEVYELGILQGDKIIKADKGVAYELNVVLARIIRDYLRLYNKVNLNAAYPTIYKKAIYENLPKTSEDFAYEGGSVEEANMWAEKVEEVANKFEPLASGWEPSQKEVDEAFDMLKKIFLGLWT